MIRTLVLVALTTSLFAGHAHAAEHRAKPQGTDYIPTVDRPGILLTSNGTASLAARETAGPDTFVLYGGPGHPTEGKFQLANGTTPDWGGGNGLPGGYGGGPDAWTPVDRTEELPLWNVDTFNAENLNSNGPGNRAMWCGFGPGDPRAADFVTVPGYGHNWNTWLLCESAPVADPGTGQTVDLDFYFNFDHEPGYGDMFVVEYDSAGTWTEVLNTNDVGSNKLPGGVFPEPGETFANFAFRTIRYVGFDYGGNDGDQVRIRLRFQSDGGWDPEDGLWPTDAGAVQVDDITLATSQGTFTEDFEGSGPYLFEPLQIPFAGDFTDVYSQFTDIDPCRSNNTPVVGFIDYGQAVRNGPGVDGTISTGGSTTSWVDYGIPGNYVVNYTDGISGGEVAVENEVWSPEIVWDLPGTADDDPAISGVALSFDVWNDRNLQTHIAYDWAVRGDAGDGYGEWASDFLLHGDGLTGPRGWFSQTVDATALLGPSVQRVQIALACITDAFGWSTAATPSPVFDNVRLAKYRLQGPVISTRTIDLAQDGFPVNGSIDVSTSSARDGLDIPFDMARDVNTGDFLIAPGDSVTVDVTSLVPGADLTDLRMVWALNTNPLFEDAIRAAPARAKDVNVAAGAAGTIWTGEVEADMSMTASGAVVDDRFFVDLPDVDFMYPGDVLHYYFQATDSDGRVSTMPYDISGFGDFSPETVFDRTFTVRGLPTITDAAGAQPDILVINDFGRRGGEAAFTTTFRNLGYLEGLHHDTYTVPGGSARVSGGIGSAGAHGATGAQLSGYNHLFYLAGNLSANLLSAGSGSWGTDKSQDIGTLEDWHALAGTRNIAYFGDYIAEALRGDSVTGAYLTNTMGVEYVSYDVRDVIGGQLSPVITPSPYGTTWFATDFVANGTCFSINQFDEIRPVAGAEAGHYFTSTDGTPIMSVAASVIHPTANGIDITFPYGSLFIENVLGREVGVSARTQVFGEILGLFNAQVGGAPVAVPSVQPVRLSALPNPFNPSTVVRFTARLGSRGSVQVFNLRGELVRTLHAGEFQTQEFRWEGTDERGAPVSSGVYLIKATDGRVTQTQKVALVK